MIRNGLLHEGAAALRTTTVFLLICGLALVAAPARAQTSGRILRPNAVVPAHVVALRVRIEHGGLRRG